MIRVSTFSSRLEMTFSLSATLAPPRMAVKGRTGVVDRVAQVLDFLLHQVAHSGIADVLGDAGGGAVSAMAAAEGVVHVGVSQGSQLLAEGVDVLGLLLAEAGVLQQDNVAVRHGGDSGLGLGADDLVVIGEGDGLAQLLRQADRHGGQAELGLRAVFGLAEVAAQNDLGAVCDQLFDGGQCRVDAVIVGDDAVLHGDVEVNTDQHALAGVIFIIDGLFT